MNKFWSLLGAALVGGAVFVGGSAARAQSTNPDVLALMANINGATSPDVKAAFVAQALASPPAGMSVGNLMSALLVTGGIGQNSNAIMAAVVSAGATSTNPAVQSAVGNALGAAVVALAAAGFNGAASTMATSALQNSVLSASVGNGIAQAVSVRPAVADGISAFASSNLPAALAVVVRSGVTQGVLVAGTAIDLGITPIAPLVPTIPPCTSSCN